MSTMPVPVIHRWSVDHDMGWLRIDVHFPAPVGQMTFYRVMANSSGTEPVDAYHLPIGKYQWRWNAMSMANKPSSGVREGGHLLSQAVLQHPVLSKISDYFGIELTR